MTEAHGHDLDLSGASAPFALRPALFGTGAGGAGGADCVRRGDPCRSLRAPPDDRFRLLQGRRRRHRRLFPGRGRRGPRHRPCSGDALLSRHDARRAGGRRPAPRRLRPSDGSRRRLLRSRAHRRARLAADRRHDADQVRLRLVGFAGAAQSLPARRGDGADGLHQSETVGAGCRRHTGHRRAADRLRPDRPRPFAPRAGHARRRDRFRLRKPRRRQDDAGVRRRGREQDAFRPRRRKRL